VLKNSRTSEATTKLGEIVTAAKSHALANSDVLGNPTWPAAAGDGPVDLSSTNLFDYAITSGAAANASTISLTVTATGTITRVGQSFGLPACPRGWNPRI
jgi:hypothetical protein